MRKLNLLLLVGLLWLPLASSAAISTSTPVKKTDPNPQARKLAETVSMITGVAISPLLGVSVVGAHEWWKTPQEKRNELPWFANPWFWGPALVLVGICFLKDSAGIAIPSVLKKPFDMAEAVENKISGLVATAAFVPIAAAIFESHDQPSASLAQAGLAAIDLHWLYNILMVPVAMIAFFMVFLASNTINMLILLSPFSSVDAALKAFRAAMLGSVALTSLANPWVGAAWALIIILFSWLIAGWSFRLSHFGMVFIWDFFTGRRNRFHPNDKANKMFLGSKVKKVASRTYGKLSRNETGELVFKYRPWLVLPKRSIILPDGNYEAGRGIFYSEILRVEGQSVKTMILLPPRYRGHEEEVATIYQLGGTRDVGIRATWAWFKSLFGGKRAIA